MRVSKENLFINANEVAELLGTSKSSAYRLIKRLNLKLESMGKITVSGKTSRKFFEEKMYI